MVIESKTYWVVEGTPTEEDVQHCVELASNDKMRIDLCWFGPDNKFYGGHHSCFIDPNSSVNEVYESMKSIVYGL